MTPLVLVLLATAITVEAGALCVIALQVKRATCAGCRRIFSEILDGCAIGIK